MNSTRQSKPDLQTLVGLFYPQPADLGLFEEVTAEAMPTVYQRLLAHHDHMTVTVEKHHDCSVNVQVLDVLTEGSHYSRKIVLRRQSDGVVVQFGIVRLNFDYLQADVRNEIEDQNTPLGRILIEHNVMREVQLTSLWRIEAGSDLCKIFETDSPTEVYGRTALIYCNGEPAVELLEIVTPA